MLDADPHADVCRGSDGPTGGREFPEQPSVKSIFPTRRWIIWTLTITDVLKHAGV